MSSFFFEADYLRKKHFKIKGFEFLDDKLFQMHGSFLISDFSAKVERLSNHLLRGIEFASNYETKNQFLTWQEKSLALESIIIRQIKEIKPRSVGLLFSGGRDSCMLGKLLIESGKEVTAYHVSPPHDSTSLANHQTQIRILAKSIGINNIEFTKFGAKPGEHLRVFNGLPLSVPAAVGLSGLAVRTSLLNQKIICFGQGADTLSNVVHTQLNYYDKRELINIFKVIQIFVQMYTKTWPVETRLIAFLQVTMILVKSRSGLRALTNFEMQNVSRILGMYLVHTPFDSQFVYEIAKNYDLKVFDPFHTFEVAKLYFTPVIEKAIKTESQKIEIDLMIERHGISGLNYFRVGFGTFFIDALSNICEAKTFRKYLLELL